jgi:hypothetical protein
VRYRLMATYRGSPFEAGIGPTDGEIVLFAACPPPEDLGFEPATGHWRKQLHIDEVQAVWESKPIGTFRGERCLVLDDLGDRLHIGYMGHDGYQAERLGYWQVDRGVFELVAARSEVTDILEERTEYPRLRGTEPAAAGHSAGPADYPPPGSPQDQARYLPPDGPQDQASYLLDRPGYFQTQPEYQIPPGTGYQQEPALPGSGASITLPPTAEPPLPLEAAALRAATASRPVKNPPAPVQAAPVQTIDEPAAQASPRPAGSGRAHRSARRRLATERVFAELAGLAGISVDAYAIGEEVEGALCLLQTDQGFEVFHSANGNRHELQYFSSEEAACFYLFGVLAADAVRRGSLQPTAGSTTGQLPVIGSAR